MEPVAWLAVKESGAKHFESAIGEDLSPMPRLGVRQMTVIAPPGELESLPEIHHVNDGLDGILRPEKAIGKQQLTAEQVKGGKAPGHLRRLQLHTHRPAAVGDVLGLHAGLDLPQKLWIAVEGVEIGQKNVGGDRIKLGFLHRSGEAEPIGLVGHVLDKIVRLEQLDVGELLVFLLHGSFQMRAGPSSPVFYVPTPPPNPPTSSPS